jgi:hypothetical protein
MRCRGDRLGLDGGVGIDRTAVSSKQVHCRDLVVAGERGEAFLVRRLQGRLVGSRWCHWGGSERQIGLGQGDRSMATDSTG